MDVNPVMIRLCTDPAFNAEAEVFARRGNVRFHAAEGRFFVRRFCSIIMYIHVNNGFFFNNDKTA